MNRTRQFSRLKLGGAALALLALFASTTPGCSKDNAVDQSTKVNQNQAQCGGDSDKGCGVGSVCVLGSCRHGCTNDAECPQGSLCIGDRAPFGCTTAEEGACKADSDCPGDLACGIDGKCRHSCETDRDCPRNEHSCVANTCVSHSEPGAEETWFSCTEGEEACVSNPANFEITRSPRPDTSRPEDGMCELKEFLFNCDSDDCRRRVWLQGESGSIGGNSDVGEGSVHMICNVVGPGWQVLADCGSWAYCIGALPNSGFGGIDYDYTCHTAKNPPLESEYCSQEWYGEPECEQLFLEERWNETICHEEVLADCSAPFSRKISPETPCP